MGRQYETISPDLARFLTAQHVFFVGSAPSDGGHVNVSPKGLDTFRVLDERTVGYLDLTGSGAETIAHIRQNGRLTLMFCAFTGKPRIVRLQGTASVVTLDDASYAAAAAPYPQLSGARAVITLEVDRVADSCGYAVPVMDYVGQRDDLIRWAERKSPDDLAAYREDKNAVSIDGIPAWGAIDAVSAPPNRA